MFVHAVIRYAVGALDRAQASVCLRPFHPVVAQGSFGRGATRSRGGASDSPARTPLRKSAERVFASTPLGRTRWGSRLGASTGSHHWGPALFAGASFSPSLGSALRLPRGSESTGHETCHRSALRIARRQQRNLSTRYSKVCQGGGRPQGGSPGRFHGMHLFLNHVYIHLVWILNVTPSPRVLDDPVFVPGNTCEGRPDRAPGHAPCHAGSTSTRF